MPASAPKTSFRTSGGSAGRWRRAAKAAMGAALALACWLCAGPACAQATSGSSAALRLPTAIAYDAAGNLFIADADRNQVVEATLAGTLQVVAGTGVQGYSGDGGDATAAELNQPAGLAFGQDGTLYIADTGNARVRAMRGGVITTFAGNGAVAYGGDGGVATAASLRAPAAMAVDASGALLICDATDHRVRRVAGGVISTLAGTGVQGFSGDGGPATAAELDTPSGIAAAADGRVFIADTHNQRVRVVAADGTLSTFAGTGQAGFSGDGGPAGNAMLSGPRGLVLDAGGALWIADSGNQRLRTVSVAGIISSPVGAGIEGTSNDGTGALSADLRAPRALAVSGFGLVTLADTLNGTVRVLTPSAMLFRPAALVFGSGRAGSTVTVNASASHAYGSSMVSASVGGPVGVPQGTVTLTEGGSVVASGSLNAGIASLIAPALGAGSHTLTANYDGDGLNAAAVSTPFALAVTAAPILATANAATMLYGSAVPSLSGTLAGVLPQDSGKVSAVFSSTAADMAPVGTYPITAALTGPASANYVLSMAANSGSLQITPAPSATQMQTLSASYTGLPLHLSASVASQTRGQPTGTVVFLDGGTAVATAPLVNGSASAVFLAPGTGSHSLSARYSGDANFLASTAPVVLESVSALPDFGMALATSTMTVAAGNTALATLQVAAQPAPFTGVVVFSATGLPPGGTVRFSPVQVVPGAGSASVQVSIVTPIPQARVRPAGRSSAVYTGVALAGCFGLMLCRRRRLVGLAGVALLLAGCGARTVGEASVAGAAQSYAVQITGTSTNLLGVPVSHTATLNLTVQN